MSDTRDIFSPMAHLLKDESLNEAGNVTVSEDDLRWMMSTLDNLQSKMAGDDKSWFKRKILPKYWRVFENEELNEGMKQLQTNLSSLVQKVEAMNKYLGTPPGKRKYPEIPAIWKDIVDLVSKVKGEL